MTIRLYALLTEEKKEEKKPIQSTKYEKVKRAFDSKPVPFPRSHIPFELVKAK